LQEHEDSLFKTVSSKTLKNLPIWAIQGTPSRSSDKKTNNFTLNANNIYSIQFHTSLAKSRSDVKGACLLILSLTQAIKTSTVNYSL